MFSCGRLPIDGPLVEAGYGARLIYDEVKDGGKGVVWDRQSAFGEKEVIEQEILPRLDAFYLVIRQWMKTHFAGSGSDETIELRDGRVHMVASPQRSFGYLYLSAVLEKE